MDKSPHLFLKNEGIHNFTDGMNYVGGSVRDIILERSFIDGTSHFRVNIVMFA